MKYRILDLNEIPDPEQGDEYTYLGQPEEWKPITRQWTTNHHGTLISGPNPRVIRRPIPEESKYYIYRTSNLAESKIV